MEQETQEQSISQDETRRDVAAIIPSQGDVVGAPPTQEVPCPTCGAASMPLSYIYVLGRIEACFPRLSVEKEFAQVRGRDRRKNRSTGFSCGVVKAREPLPGAPNVLGVHHSGTGDLYPATAEPGRLRSLGGCHPSCA